MLGKLIKHEFRATRRNFTLLFAVLFGITLLMKPLFWIRQGMMEAEDFPITVTELIVIWLFFLMLSVFATAAQVLIAVRYYQSLTCDEAYLTFTLPVTPVQIIWSKVIVGGIWNLVAVIFSLLCILLAFAGTPFMQNAGPFLWDDMSLRVSAGSFVLGGLELFPILISQNLLLICAVGIGQLFGKYRLMGTIGSYFIINTAMSILLFVAGLLTGVISFAYSELDTGEVELLAQTAENMASKELMITLVYVLISGTVAFLAARYTFTKKLNLE